jgi:hypothetical protein
VKRMASVLNLKIDFIIAAGVFKRLLFLLLWFLLLLIFC